MVRSKITRHVASPAVEPAPARDLPPPRADEIALIVTCAVAAAALFCGVFIDHLPDSRLLQGALVGCGILALAAAAMWLDRRGGEREAAEPDALARAMDPKVPRVPPMPRPAFRRHGTEPLGSGG
jgi:hypothetical protein